MKRFRFPRRGRLSAAGVFQRLYRAGRRIEGPHLRLYWLPSDASTSRVGIVVTRRAGVRLAARRNQLKRWLRETIRCEQPNLRSCEMICAVTGLREPLDYHILRHELVGLWQKAGLIG